MRRMFAVGISAVTAMAVPAMAVVIPADVANASGTSQISCKLASGTATGPLALKNCTGPAAILGSKVGKGSGTAVQDPLPPGSPWQSQSTTTWSPGVGGAGGTSVVGANYNLTTTACGPKAVTVVIAGQVIGGTATSLIGDSTSSTLCYKKGKLKNLKGTLVLN